MATTSPVSIPMSASPSNFIISLDFELRWGILDQPWAHRYADNVRGVHQAIPHMLRTFSAFEVRATWAVVGLLLASTRSEMLSSLPQRRPRYGNSSYHHLEEVGEDEQADPLHFGGSLVSQIAADDTQEVATHTFSHFLCHEEGQDAEDFEADIAAAVAVARNRGIQFETIVFPRNQVKPEYFDILRRHGIRNYRGGVISDQVALAGGAFRDAATRARRLLDTYLPITREKTVHVRLDEWGMVNVPASRFLRPFNPRARALEGLRLARIKDEMTATARAGGSYHLWWHPHNFGIHTEENIAFLTRVLEHFAELREQYGMQSVTMAEAADDQLLRKAV